MSTNKTEDGKLNLCGSQIALLRRRMVPKTTPAAFAKKLSQNGLPIHEKELKEIEAGQRAVTDIELKAIADQFDIFADTLLIDSKDTFSRIAPVPGNRFACCADCRYFLQHYIKDNGVLTAVNCGHCIYAGARRKLPLNADCPYFEAAEVKQTEMLQVNP